MGDPDLLMKGDKKIQDIISSIQKKVLYVYLHILYTIWPPHSPLITEENKFKTSLRGSCKAKFNSQFYRDDNQKQTTKKEGIIRYILNVIS